jgi:hypothetical protein
LTVSKNRATGAAARPSLSTFSAAAKTRRATAIRLRPVATRRLRRYASSSPTTTLYLPRRCLRQPRAPAAPARAVSNRPRSSVPCEPRCRRPRGIGPRTAAPRAKRRRLMARARMAAAASAAAALAVAATTAALAAWRHRMVGTATTTTTRPSTTAAAAPAAATTTSRSTRDTSRRRRGKPFSPTFSETARLLRPPI